MAFKHACFISYRSARQPLAERFLKELYEGLSAELALLIDSEIYLDWSRLQSGDVWSGQIARAICESACMIAVYTPNYFSTSHTWSAREYAAMELLEKKRRALLKPGKITGLILPVILRRAQHMPPAIAGRQWSDFSDYLLSSERGFLRNRRYREQLRNIAGWIAQVNEDLAELPPGAMDCGSFSLPSEEDIRSYLEEQTALQRPTLPFPR